MQLGGSNGWKFCPQGQIPGMLNNTNLSVESRISSWKECRGFKAEKQCSQTQMVLLNVVCANPGGCLCHILYKPFMHQQT